MKEIVLTTEEGIANYYLDRLFNFMSLEHLNILLSNYGSEISECIVLPNLKFIAEKHIKKNPDFLKDKDLDAAIEAGDFDEIYEDLYINWYPMWGTVFITDDNFCLNNVEKLYDIGIGVMFHKEIGVILFIPGAGYDFYSKHWIPLFRDIYK